MRTCVQMPTLETLEAQTLSHKLSAPPARHAENMSSLCAHACTALRTHKPPSCSHCGRADVQRIVLTQACILPVCAAPSTVRPSACKL